MIYLTCFAYLRSDYVVNAYNETNPAMSILAKLLNFVVTVYTIRCVFISKFRYVLKMWMFYTTGREYDL